VELYAGEHAMKIFPCNIDVYTIIKDFLTIIVIPSIGIFFAHFYIRTKKDKFDRFIKKQNELDEKIKKSRDYVVKTCKKLNFSFNIKTNEFSYNYGNGSLFVRLPFINKDVNDIFDSPFFLVYWKNWINKNHSNKNIEDQKKEGIPFEDDCKDLEEYIQKLIKYRMKQSDNDVE